MKNLDCCHIFLYQNENIATGKMSQNFNPFYLLEQKVATHTDGYADVGHPLNSFKLLDFGQIVKNQQ